MSRGNRRAHCLLPSHCFPILPMTMMMMVMQEGNNRCCMKSCASGLQRLFFFCFAHLSFGAGCLPPDHPLSFLDKSRSLQQTRCDPIARLPCVSYKRKHGTRHHEALAHLCAKKNAGSACMEKSDQAMCDSARYLFCRPQTPHFLSSFSLLKNLLGRHFMKRNTLKWYR